MDPGASLRGKSTTCRRYISGSATRSYGAFASNSLSRGFMPASDAGSSVDCTQPAISRPNATNVNPFANFIASPVVHQYERPAPESSERTLSNSKPAPVPGMRPGLATKPRHLLQGMPQLSPGRRDPRHDTTRPPPRSALPPLS